MVSGGFVTVIVVLAVAGCGGLPESVTWNVSSVGGVIPVGVPLTIPVAEFNVKPVGSVAEVNCQTYGVVPPFAVSENVQSLSLIHISEPTRQAETSYAVFCLTK